MFRIVEWILHIHTTKLQTLYSSEKDILSKPHYNRPRICLEPRMDTPYPYTYWGKRLLKYKIKLYKPRYGKLHISGWVWTFHTSSSTQQNYIQVDGTFYIIKIIIVTQGPDNFTFLMILPIIIIILETSNMFGTLEWSPYIHTTKLQNMYTSSETFFNKQRAGGKLQFSRRGSSCEIIGSQCFEP